MRAADVMTPNVTTVDPDTTVQDLAKLLSERGISGAPVVDSTGRIVSEGDLLHRTEIGTERRSEHRRSWWLDHFASERARDYVKSHGRAVKDIMTRDVVSVTEGTDLADVATLLETNGSSVCRSRAMARSSASSAGPIWCGRWGLHKAWPPPIPTRTTAQSAPGCSPNSGDRSGPGSGRRTSSSATASCICGFRRTSRRKSGRRYGLPPRTSPARMASRNMSCRRP
jgi:CBS domain-containing protein